MSAECHVFSPCGRFQVNFSTDGVKVLRIAVTANLAASSGAVPGSGGGGGGGVRPLRRGPQFTASLDEAQVLELTTAAGVRKTFRNFSEMVYNALIGRAACVRFYVESCVEMKRRIAADVLCRRGDKEDDHGHDQDEEGRRGLSCGGDGSSDSILLLPEELQSQRFLTIDYDVDFTRAVFPIPLHPQGPAAGVGVGVGGEEEVSESAEATPVRAVTAAAVDEKLCDAAATIEELQSENARLRAENAALVRLSKEKMLEMQRLCEDFEGRVHAAAEVERLQKRNAQLRQSLEAAERALEEERRRGRLSAGGSDRSTRSRPANADYAGRGRSASRDRSNSNSNNDRGRRRHNGGGSPNPYLRTLSRGSSRSSLRGASAGAGAAQRSSRASSTTSADGRRAASRTAAQQQQQRRRPLVSPTPPPSRSRRSGSRPGASRNRFDTPPRPLSSSTSVRPTTAAAQQYGGGGGGDSPAPRGRSGNRSLDDHYPPNTLKPWRRAGSPCGSSRASSVASSTGSHERLFRTSTAASRSRQVSPAALPMESAHRRAVFR